MPLTATVWVGLGWSLQTEAISEDTWSPGSGGSTEGCGPKLKATFIYLFHFKIIQFEHKRPFLTFLIQEEPAFTRGNEGRRESQKQPEKSDEKYWHIWLTMDSKIEVGGIKIK